MANSTMAFTIRYEDSFEDKVRIPGDYKNILKDGPKGVDLLLGKYGRVWEATKGQEEDKDGWKITLAGDWDDFVRENKITAGDDLKFNYTGESSFIVQIFKPSGSKKAEASGSSKSTGDSSKRRGRKPAYHGTSANMIETNEWIDYLARSCCEPYFKFIFTAHYLKKAVINVPVDFANNWLSRYGDSTNVLFQNFDEQIAAMLRFVRKDGLITKCEIFIGVREFTDQYNVHVDEGALIKFREGHPAVFDVELVLV